MHIRLVMRHACYQNYGHVNMFTTHHLRVAAPDLQSCTASAVNSQLDVELLHALRNLKFSGTKIDGQSFRNSVDFSISRIRVSSL